MNKLITAGAVVALFVASAIPSFASNTNFGFVSNDVRTSSNTGRNLTIGGGFAQSQTGSAWSQANVTTVVNSNQGSSKKSNNINFGVVDNDVTTRSNTGRNLTIGGGFAQSATGDATSVSCVTTVVNTNVK